MKTYMKRTLSFLLCLALVFTLPISVVFAEGEAESDSLPLGASEQENNGTAASRSSLNEQDNSELYYTMEGQVRLWSFDDDDNVWERGREPGRALPVRVRLAYNDFGVHHTDTAGYFSIQILKTAIDQYPGDYSFEIDINEPGFRHSYWGGNDPYDVSHLQAGEPVVAIIEEGGYADVNIPFDHLPAAPVSPESNGEIAVLAYVYDELSTTPWTFHEYYSISESYRSEEWRASFFSTQAYKFAFTYYDKSEIDYNNWDRSIEVIEAGIFQYFTGEDYGALTLEDAPFISVQLGERIDLYTCPWAGDRGHAQEDIYPPYASVAAPYGVDNSYAGLVNINFSEPMDTMVPGTVRFLHVEEAEKTATNGRWTEDKMQYTADYSDLTPGRHYTVEVSGFADIAGNVMETNSVHGFAIMGGYTERTLRDDTTGIAITGDITPDAEIDDIPGYVHDAGTCDACDAIHQADTQDLLLALHGISVMKGSFTGYITITIPVGIEYNGMEVSVLHCKNGELETKTATVTGGKVTFTLDSLSPIAIALLGDTTPPTLSGGTAERTSDISVQIRFYTDEAGSIYGLALESSAGAPTKETVKSNGVSLGAIAGTGFTGAGLDITAGAKDVYIVMEDAAGNISDPLKIPVPAYNPVPAQAITGVTSPVAGATPSTGINNGTGYTATLVWNGNPPQFTDGTEYTAAITLTASSGYTFSGVFGDTAAISGFTVNGIAPVWVSNNGTILEFIVTFPAATGATYTATIDPTGKTFPAATEGYGTLAAQLFAVTNTGNTAILGPEAALQNGTDSAFEISTPLSSTGIGPGGSSSLFVRPKTGLAAGIYSDNLVITGSGGISLTAGLSFTVNAAATYLVTVQSAGTGATGGGSYAQGAVVNISAGTPPAGMQFKNWTTASTGVVFNNANSAGTSFTMPAGAVTVTAIFEKIPATVTDVTVNPSSVTVQAGTDYQFGATVTGTNNPSQGVTWGVADNNDSGTTIHGGLLVVAAGETAATLTVTATSAVDSTKSGTATVTVSSSAPPTPTVTSVTVTPAAITMNRGDTHTFGAVVSGTNSPGQNVSWTVTGGTAGTAIAPDGTLTVAAGETATTLTIRATSMVDSTKSGTATVTVALPVQPTTYTITFNANGGSVTPTSMQTGADGKLTSLPMPTRSGSYTFDGWFTASSGGVAVTTGRIYTANTTIYAQWTYTGNSGSGSFGGGGGGSRRSSDTTTTTPTLTTTWLEKGSAGTLAANAKSKNEGYARTRSGNMYGVRSAALQALAGLKYEHDTIVDGAVQVRLRINNPEKITKDIMASGFVKDTAVDWARGYFEKWFKNKVRVVHLDQQGDWGQPVEIAAKVDVTGMDTKNLHFYVYNKATNNYRHIEKPAYWIDSNGYIHFTTELGGDIIISEGALEKK